MTVGNAHRTDVVSFGEEQFEDFLPVIHHPFGIGDDLHVLPRQGHTGREQFGSTFDFDNAQPAGAAFGQAVQMTEGRYIDAVLAGNGQNGLIFSGADIPVIYLESQDADRIEIAVRTFHF